MTLCEARTKYTKLMVESGIESAAFDFYAIMDEAFGIPREKILACPEDILPAEKEKALKDMVSRYCCGEPLQYILGAAWFMGRRFKAAPGALIPRGDTETVCLEALDILGKMPAGFSPSVLDLCCGTGCIGLSLAAEDPLASVVLSDISDDALAICGENLAAFPENVRRRCSIVKSDLMTDISGRFDLIVSNPPYIRSDVLEGLDRSVRDYEPALALDGGADGLAFYREIIKEAPSRLRAGGTLLFETGYDQMIDVTGLLEASGHFTEIAAGRDNGGNYRWVRGTLLS